MNPFSSRAGLARRAFLAQLGGAAVAPPILRAQQTPARVRSSGAVGQVERVDGEIAEYKDQETGARVMRLLSGTHLYFTSESFLDNSSNRLVFHSSRGAGGQYYLLEIKERRLVQLTNWENLHGEGCLSPNGHLLYFNGQVLHSLEVDTLADRELYRVPDGWREGIPTCTPDGKYVTFAYSERLSESTRTSVEYSSLFEDFFQRRGSVIMRLHTGTGQPMAVWGERALISHVLIDPLNPEMIVFCHEGGSMSPQRMWTVNAAVPRNRTAVPLYPQKPNEYCVHEYFTRQGEVGYQYEIDREGHREYYNCCIRTDGSWLRQYLLPGRRPGHIQSNSDNTLVAGDCGYLSEDDKDGGQYMSLMTHSNGRAQVRRLCRRNPGENQASHGHPVFSGDDRWVLFNSRIGQANHIFMADVHSI